MSKRVERKRCNYGCNSDGEVIKTPRPKCSECDRGVKDGRVCVKCDGEGYQDVYIDCPRCKGKAYIETVVSDEPSYGAHQCHTCGKPNHGFGDICKCYNGDYD